MRNRALIASVFLLMTWSDGALGNVIVSLNNPGSTSLHEIGVEPGDAYDVDLNLTTPESLYLITLAFEASTSNVFEILQVTDTLPWSSAGSPSIVGTLSPQSGTFGTGYPSPDYFGPGMANLAAMRLQVAPETPTGTYTLEIVDPQFHWSRFNPVEPWPASPGPAFIVHVVPEPASVTLVVFLGMFLVRRWH